LVEPVVVVVRLVELLEPQLTVAALGQKRVSARMPLQTGAVVVVVAGTRREVMAVPALLFFQSQPELASLSLAVSHRPALMLA
jgi:hypothetical protein